MWVGGSNRVNYRKFHNSGGEMELERKNSISICNSMGRSEIWDKFHEL